MVDLKAGKYVDQTVADLTGAQLSADIYKMNDEESNLR